MKEQIRNKWIVYACLFVLELMCIVIFQYKAGTSYIDSDMSGLMVYAQQLNQEHAIVSENWYYSTEISYLDECHLYKITLVLFPNNWHAARVVAKGVALFLAAVSFIYMCYGVGLREESILGAMVLIAPFGVWQTYHMVFDPSYTTSVFYLCLIYGSILHISQQSKCKVLHYAIMIIISILAGLTGPRLLLVAMAPILVAAIITYFIRVREYKGVLLRKSFELRLLINSCLATLVVIIGYYINAVYLNKKYTFADSSQTWRSFSIADVCASLSDFLSNFGYVGLFYGEVDVMSIRGLVTGGLGILFAVLIIFMYIRLIGRVKKIDSPYRFLIISGISTIFICCIFFGLMEGLGGGNGGYYISIIAIIIVDAIIEIATEDFMFIYSRKIMTLSMLLGVAMLSVVHSKMFVENGGYRHPEGIEGVVAAIEENEAYNGYATFWNSSIITEISNGQIETWTVEDLVTSGLVVKPWFQNKSHITEKPEGKVFIAALTRDECANMISIPGMTDKLVYQVGDNNMVFIFENIDELMNYVPLAE